MAEPGGGVDGPRRTAAERAALLERRLEALEQEAAARPVGVAPGAAPRAFSVPLAVLICGVLVAAAIMFAVPALDRHATSVSAALTAAEDRQDAREAAAAVAAARVEEMQAIGVFLPLVISNDSETVRKAFQAIAALGYGDLATKLAALTSGNTNAAALGEIATATAVDETTRTVARAALEAAVLPHTGALAHVVVNYRAGDGVDLRSNGFLIDERGYLITTVHPFDAYSPSLLDAKVHFGPANGPGADATFVSKDGDLALLKVDSSAMVPMRLSHDPSTGSPGAYVTVLSFNSEAGAATPSAGRVTARTANGLLQIDAAPGTSVSGAPVFNAAGEVIAITRIALGQPIGTAVPIERALQLLEATPETLPN